MFDWVLDTPLPMEGNWQKPDEHLSYSFVSVKYSMFGHAFLRLIIFEITV